MEKGRTVFDGAEHPVHLGQGQLPEAVEFGGAQGELGPGRGDAAVEKVVLNQGAGHRRKGQAEAEDDNHQEDLPNQFSERVRTPVFEPAQAGNDKQTDAEQRRYEGDPDLIDQFLNAQAGDGRDQHVGEPFGHVVDGIQGLADRQRQTDAGRFELEAGILDDGDRGVDRPAGGVGQTGRGDRPLEVTVRGAVDHR